MSARFSAVGVVASTGGPSAIADLLHGLPKDFPVPVLVVQHLLDGGMATLARALAARSSLEVHLAESGGVPKPGHVYLQQDGTDLTVDLEWRFRLGKNDDWATAGDRLLVSLATALGARSCGVVLTGLGEDGKVGLQAVRDAGGVSICQDEASAAASPMPLAAKRVAEHVVALPQLAGFLDQQLKGAR